MVRRSAEAQRRSPQCMKLVAASPPVRYCRYRQSLTKHLRNTCTSQQECEQDTCAAAIAGHAGVASDDCGASKEAGVAPGTAIEHVVAAREAAQALEGLDSAEVRTARACQ